MSCDLPCRFLLVPSIRMYAAVDGAIYDISLSHELVRIEFLLLAQQSLMYDGCSAGDVTGERFR